jgi:hypothetical protein
VKQSEWAPGVLEDFHEQALGLYDFKTCRKADGTTYGVPDGSNCVLGKEYTPQQKKNAEHDLFRATKKMVTNLNNLKEFNKGLAEFHRANNILAELNPGLGKIPLHATSGAAAQKIVGMIVKAVSAAGIGGAIQRLYDRFVRPDLEPPEFV